MVLIVQTVRRSCNNANETEGSVTHIDFNLNAGTHTQSYVTASQFGGEAAPGMQDIEHGVPSPYFRKAPKLEFNKDLVPSEELKHVELLP